MRFFLLSLISIVLSCEQNSVPLVKPGPVPTAKSTLKSPVSDIRLEKAGEVTVAAIQCYSRMGSIQYNRQLLESFIRSAAQSGAKIIVLPEAAITGYMDPGRNISWTRANPDKNEKLVDEYAETVPGDSSRYFSQLAKELQIYLTIPLIEKNEDKLYNTLLLANPAGEIIAHHRKQNIWTPGDGAWCDVGNLPAQVVETEYGRLGLMICFDLHVMPEKLAEKKADIVLYSVGWFGPNTNNWYSDIFPRRYVKPYNYHLIAANWSGEKKHPSWPGQGYSNIVLKGGKVLNITSKSSLPAIVLGTIPLSDK